MAPQRGKNSAKKGSRGKVAKRAPVSLKKALKNRLNREEKKLQKQITEEGLGGKGKIPKGNIALTKKTSTDFHGKNDEIKKKNPKKNRIVERAEQSGVIVVSNLPHGFFEDGLERFFKQFGKVTRVRHVRSPNTGRSCGYGYVEFEHDVVAEMAATSMNNYLTYGKILKCKYLGNRRRMADSIFRIENFDQTTYPKIKTRERAIAELNQERDPSDLQKMAMRDVRKFEGKLKALDALGIKLDLQWDPTGFNEVLQERKKRLDQISEKSDAVEQNVTKKAKTEVDEKKQDQEDEQTEKKKKRHSVRSKKNRKPKETTGEGKIRQRQKRKLEHAYEKDKSNADGDEGVDMEEQNSTKKAKSEVNEKIKQNKKENEQTKMKRKRNRSKENRTAQVKNSETKEDTGIKKKSDKTQKNDIEKSSEKKANAVLRENKTASNTRNTPEVSEELVFEADQSDDEIAFKTPARTRKKLVKITPTSPAKKLHLTGLPRSTSSETPSKDSNSSMLNTQNSPSRIPKTPKGKKARIMKLQSSTAKSTGKKKMPIKGSEENATSKKKKRLSL